LSEVTTEKTEKKLRGKTGGYHPGSGRKLLMDKKEPILTSVAALCTL
jgi:hypothetical protein